MLEFAQCSVYSRLEESPPFFVAPIIPKGVYGEDIERRAFQEVNW